MTAPPRVTVVINTRNRRALLPEAVASVERQVGPTPEMIVVDDASTDDTWAYVSTLANVGKVRLDRRGKLSVARNRGLAEAHGEHIMFLDDDDLLWPHALQVLGRALDEHPEAVAAVGARQDWFVGEGYRRRDIHPFRMRVRPMFDELLFGWNAVSGQNLYRTEVVRSVGGFDESVEQVEDRDLWLRVSRRGPLVLCPQTVMTYRRMPNHALPADIRERRERVARRAIRALPRPARRRALLVRCCTSLVDHAEDDVRLGHPWRAFPKVLRAAWLAPRLLLSPLIGTWIARRLVGRAYHRYWKR